MHCQFILIYIILAGMALMFLAGAFKFLDPVSKAPVCDEERKREQKRLRRSQLLMLKFQISRMFLSVTLSELIALLKALHSGWSLPMDLVIRMLNSKFWVMEADVWADLLYICRWANPNISLKDVLCGICETRWTEPVTSQCGHTFCRFCLLKSKNSKKSNECEICCVKLTFALFTDFNAEKLRRMYKEEHPEEDGSSEPRADQTHELTDGASTSQATAVIAQGSNISRKDVLCGICKTRWTEPVTSQCGHTFCRFCLLKSKNSKKSNECEICCVKLTFALFTDFNAEKLRRMYKEEHPEEDGSSEPRADQTHELTDGASTSQATAVIAQGSNCIDLCT